MRLSILAIIVLCFTVCAAQATVYDIYIAAGQSNMDGRADKGDLTGNLASPQAGRLIYYANPANPSNSGESTITSGWQTLAPGYSIPPGQRGASLPTNAFGPEISFASAMADSDASPNAVAIIKVARGGTNLHTDWSPTGYMYNGLISQVNAGMTGLINAGDTGVIRGMLWHQGESDVADINNYQSNLEQLIADVRTEFGNPNLPFLIGELAQTKNSAFRSLQASIAQTNAGVGFASSLGLDTTDGTHFDTTGQVLIGERFAQEMVLLVPEPASLILLGLGGMLLINRRHRAS